MNSYILNKTKFCIHAHNRQINVARKQIYISVVVIMIITYELNGNSLTSTHITVCENKRQTILSNTVGQTQLASLPSETLIQTGPASSEIFLLLQLNLRVHYSKTSTCFNYK